MVVPVMIWKNCSLEVLTRPRLVFDFKEPVARKLGLITSALVGYDPSPVA